MAPLTQVLYTFHGTAIIEDHAVALPWLHKMLGGSIVALEADEHGLLDRVGSMIWIGDAGFEVIQPIGHDTVAGRFLERYGSGMYSIGFQVEDIAQTCAAFDQRGIDWVGDINEGFAFCRPSQHHGLHLEWNSYRADWDPRVTDQPLPPTPSLLGVTAVSHWGVMVTDPEATLAMFGTLWPIGPVSIDSSVTEHQPQVIIPLRGGGIGLYPQPQPAGPNSRTGLRLISCLVGSLNHARQVLKAETVRLTFDEPDRIAIDPADTFGIQIVLTE
jgi:hypothetical protein